MVTEADEFHGWTPEFQKTWDEQADRIDAI